MNRSPNRQRLKTSASPIFAKNSTKIVLAAGVLAAAVGTALIWRADATETVPISEVSHIHGIAVDPHDPSQLYLATHYGLYRTSADGMARRISESTDDFMGFTPHPTDEARLYASGHPANGGNLGVIASTDGGQTWERIADGANGPVDFHAMDVSPADPQVMYGLYGDIQVSRDDGKTWEMAGAPPADVFDLAASARDPGTVYAATRAGLMISKDFGASWQPAFALKQPASLVQTEPDGMVYAFVLGTGLVKTTEPTLNWRPLSNAFGERILMHLAVDPTNADRLFAVTNEGEILSSADGGQTWAPLSA